MTDVRAARVGRAGQALAHGSILTHLRHRRLPGRVADALDDLERAPLDPGAPAHLQVEQAAEAARRELDRLVEVADATKTHPVRALQRTLRRCHEQAIVRVAHLEGMSDERARWLLEQAEAGLLAVPDATAAVDHLLAAAGPDPVTLVVQLMARTPRDYRQYLIAPHHSTGRRPVAELGARCALLAWWVRGIHPLDAERCLQVAAQLEACDAVVARTAAALLEGNPAKDLDQLLAVASAVARGTRTAA